MDVQKLQPGIVERAIAATKKYPKARCFIMECTQSSCFSNAVRKATGLPVFDCITNCDYLMSAHMSNPRFGLQDWQKDWDGVHEKYKFAQFLTAEQKRHLVNRQKVSPEIKTYARL